MADQARLHTLRDLVAVVGVGETDYAEDQARSRAGEPPLRDSYGLSGLV